MMSQLGSPPCASAVHYEADWFRDDPARFRRAVDESLLHGTGPAPDVPSRVAQEAWKHDAHEEWKAAWLEWALN